VFHFLLSFVHASQSIDKMRSASPFNERVEIQENQNAPFMSIEKSMGFHYLFQALLIFHYFG